MCRIRGSILLNHIKPCCKNIKISSITVLNLHIVFDNLINLYFFNTTIYSESVILMHNIIANLQIRKISDFYA